MLKRYSINEILYGILFFVVHISIEIISYTLLYIKFDTYVSLFIIFMYDFYAFVPQLLIGEIFSRNKKTSIYYFGLIFFTIAILLVSIDNYVIYILAIFILSLGNAILHEFGAITCAFVSNNNIFPSALFVSGGTIGIVVGRYFALNKVSLNILFIFVLIILIVLIFTDKKVYKNDANAFQNNDSEKITNKKLSIDIVNINYDKKLILLVAFLIIMLRSYMGFVIPIEWKETFFHTVVLSISLGIGKAVGGLLCDLVGYRLVSFISTVLCIPFIVLGNKIMFLSLIGLLLFSMTMSITYAMVLSVIKNKYGVAFGVTTIGLFAGALPLFFIKLSTYANILIIIIMSLICFLLLRVTLKHSL